MRLTQAYTGRSRYYVDLRAGEHRLLVAVRCELGEIGELSTSFYALLDIGAEWSCLPPVIATRLGHSLDVDPALPPLSSRFGRCYGRMERARLCLPADDGDNLDYDATWFISEDWTGPLVIGWKGGLDRIRSALDPNNEFFYFGSL